MNIKKPFLIGMIHLPPTVSYTGWSGIEIMVKKALTDLKNLQEAGFSAALIENDEDHPCQIEGTPDVVSPLSIVAHELKKISKIPLGIEVLINDPKASLAIAKTAGLSFIRTDYFVDKMMREGYGEFDVNPQEIIEYRKRIKAEDISILADIQVKYALMLEKKSLKTSVTQAINKGADAVIVTGKATGEMPLTADLQIALSTARGKLPVLVGSGFSEMNAKELLQYADGAIVGTSIKTAKYIDQDKAKSLVRMVNIVITANKV
jgi:membrane complex biogenesis BtpA family protein